MSLSVRSVLLIVTSSVSSFVVLHLRSGRVYKTGVPGPERNKLRPEQVEKVLRNAPPGKWIVARLVDAEILGTGDGSPQALRNAKAMHPELDLNDVAVLYATARPQVAKA